MSGFKIQVVENMSNFEFDAKLTTRSGQVFYGKGNAKQEAQDTAMKAYADHIKEQKAITKSVTFDFGEAVRKLKEGSKVARAGWNGKNMYVYYVPAASYPVERNNKSTMAGEFADDMVPYREYLALKTAQNDVSTWAPSVSDALAEDWQLA